MTAQASAKIVAVFPDVATQDLEMGAGPRAGRERVDALPEEAEPAVFNHNTETVPRLYRKARPGGRYPRTLELLDRARRYAPDIPTKSGIMVGLGEEWDEVIATLADLNAVGCGILTIGQYLSPSSAHLPVARYYHPEEFEMLKTTALSMGFGHVESGPLVRSSYHAHEQADSFQNR